MAKMIAKLEDNCLQALSLANYSLKVAFLIDWSNSETCMSKGK